MLCFQTRRRVFKQTPCARTQNSQVNIRAEVVLSGRAIKSKFEQQRTLVLSQDVGSNHPNTATIIVAAQVNTDSYNDEFKSKLRGYDLEDWLMSFCNLASQVL